jgi:hypothetical protein
MLFRLSQHAVPFATGRTRRCFCGQLFQSAPGRQKRYCSKRCSNRMAWVRQRRQRAMERHVKVV